MAIHAMVDIETLGTKPNSVVLTVGGCKFNPFTMDEPFDFFLMKLDVDQQIEQGRFVDDKTLEWWGKQDAKIREEALGDEDRTTLLDFIKQLNKFALG